MGSFRAVRIGGFGGGYATDIPRGAIGYAVGAGYGTGIRYGTGILRGRSSVLAASALAQTATSDDSTVAYVRAQALGTVQDPPLEGPSPRTASGSRLHHSWSRWRLPENSGNGSGLFSSAPSTGRSRVSQWRPCSAAFRRAIDDRQKYQGRSSGLLLDRREWAFVEAISSSTVSVTKVRAVVIEGGQQMRRSDPHEEGAGGTDRKPICLPRCERA
jgi:hypothetical protein